MRRTSLALLVGGLIAMSPGVSALAQSIISYPSSIAPVRLPPHLRVPVGSRAEAAQLKASQDELLAARTKAQKVKKKVKGR